MSDPNQPSTPPGWYPDGQGGQRWWDGSQWTEHTQPPAGGASSAPSAPAAPSAPSAPGGDLPTQVAPNRASNYPGQPGGAPQQPSAPQQPPSGAYGAPAGGQSGYGQQQYGSGGSGSGSGGGFGGSSAYPGGSSGGGGGKGKMIAIIGGAIAALLLVILLVVVLFKVVLGGGSPEDVANDYLEASVEADFERVCELVTEDDQKEAFKELDVEECGDVEDAVKEDDEFDEGEFDEYLEDFETEFEVGDVKEKDDTAEVEFTSTTEYKGDDEEIESYYKDAEETEGTIYLVKEDGDWKVDADKSDSAGIF